MLRRLIIFFLFFFISILIFSFKTASAQAQLSCTENDYKCLNNQDVYTNPSLVAGCNSTSYSDCQNNGYPTCGAPGNGGQTCYVCPHAWQCPSDCCGSDTSCANNTNNGYTCSTYTTYSCGTYTNQCPSTLTANSSSCISSCPCNGPGEACTTSSYCTQYNGSYVAGVCGANQICCLNASTPTPTPTPAPICNTCASIGASCGSGYSDGCGGTLNCGTCSSGYSCTNGTCTLNPTPPPTPPPTPAPTPVPTPISCPSGTTLTCGQGCTLFGTVTGDQCYNTSTGSLCAPPTCVSSGGGNPTPPPPGPTPPPPPPPGGVCTYTSYICPTTCQGGGTYRFTSWGQCISHSCDNRCYCDQRQNGPPGCYDQNQNYCGQPTVETHYCTTSNYWGSACNYTWWQPNNPPFCGNDQWGCYCPSWAAGWWGWIPITVDCTSANVLNYGSICNNQPGNTSTCGSWQGPICGTDTRTCLTKDCQPCSDSQTNTCPPDTISGNVFVDTNNDALKDNGEQNYTGSIIITSSGGSVSVPYGTGTFTISGLGAGNSYTIGYTNLPPGAIMTNPRNGSLPPSFTVTVGPGTCSVGGSNSAQCDGSGNISNLNFGFNYNKPWIQCQGQDCRVDAGFTDKVPTGNYASTNGAGGTPGLIFTGNATPDFGQGQASSTNWVVGGTTFGETYSPTKIGGTVKTSYNYLLSKTNQGGITPTDISAYCSGGISNCTLSSAIPHGVYIANGSLNLVGGGFTFPNGENYVILVNGNLTINERVFVPNGSTALFSAKGNITAAKTLGEAASSTSSTIEGIYSADQNFTADGNNSCTTGADLRLNIAGTVITNAAGAGGGFVNNRDLCANDIQYPSVAFFERVDFILNTPDFLKNPNFTYQEIAP